MWTHSFIGILPTPGHSHHNTVLLRNRLISRRFAASRTCPTHRSALRRLRTPSEILSLSRRRRILRPHALPVHPNVKLPLPISPPATRTYCSQSRPRIARGLNESCNRRPLKAQELNELLALDWVTGTSRWETPRLFHYSYCI